MTFPYGHSHKTNKQTNKHANKPKVNKTQAAVWQEENCMGKNICLLDSACSCFSGNGNASLWRPLTSYRQNLIM